MTAVLHRKIGTPPPTASLASKYYVVGDKLTIDLSSGAGVLGLGYDCWDVKRAMMRELNGIPYVHSSNWTTTAIEQFAQALVDHAGEPFKGGAVMFLSSGNEAMEAACKIAHQYSCATGLKGASFIGRQHSYHGNSYFTLQLGDHPRRERMNIPRDNKQLPAYNEAWLQTDMRSVIGGLSTSGYTPVVAIETIGGMASGISVPCPLYLQALRAVCDEERAILIYDEVLCGNWRTGYPYAWQLFAGNVAPDMVVMGKGLSGGYFPLSAVLVNARIVDALRDGSSLWHSTTNQNHPIGCAGGLAALSVYEKLRNNISINVIDDIARGSNLSLHGTGALWGLRQPVERLQRLVEGLRREDGIVLYTDYSAGTGEAVALIAPPYTIDPTLFENCLKTIARRLGRLDQ